VTNRDADEFAKFLRSRSMHVMEKNEVRSFGELAGNGYPLDYPIFPYYFGEKNDRSKVVLLLTVNYGTIYRKGICFSLPDTSLGSAAVLPPSNRKIKLSDFILAGGWKTVPKFGLKTTKKMAAYEEYCESLLEKHCTDDTWYFQNLTVSKMHQGEGVGSKLMNVLFEYMDAIDAPCYLETHTLSNDRLYQRFNFEVMEIGYLPGTDIKHYAMLRKRRSERTGH